MASDNTIDELNQLIQLNKDAENGLATAAKDVKNSELETLFGGYAKQHAKFAVELQEEVERLDGSYSNSGTLGGALHRSWMDLKFTVSGASAASLLASCEDGERSAEVAYAEAAEANSKGQTHTLIEKHLQQIKGFRTRLARLAGEAKDGVHFQKNE